MYSFNLRAVRRYWNPRRAHSCFFYNSSNIAWQSLYNPMRKFAAKRVSRAEQDENAWRKIKKRKVVTGGWDTSPPSTPTTTPSRQVQPELTYLWRLLSSVVCIIAFIYLLPAHDHAPCLCSCLWFVCRRCCGVHFCGVYVKSSKWNFMCALKSMQKKKIQNILSWLGVCLG